MQSGVRTRGPEEAPGATLLPGVTPPVLALLLACPACSWASCSPGLCPWRPRVRSWAAGAAWGAGLALGLPLSPAPWASLPPGTSLLQEVVYVVSQGADPDEIGLMNIDEQLPVLEYPQPGLDIIKVLSGPAAPRPWGSLGSPGDSCS